MKPIATLQLKEVDMKLTHKSFGHSPNLWHTNSDALWASALVVQLAFEKAWPEFQDLIAERWSWSQVDGFDANIPSTWSSHQRQAMEKFAETKGLSDSYRVAGMLRAQSIEAELKAAYYRKFVAEAGHVDKVKSKKTHDFGMIADEVGIPLTSEERAELGEIELLLQLGRYPVADVGKKESQTHRVSFGTNPDRDSRIREKIKPYSRG